MFFGVRKPVVVSEFQIFKSWPLLRRHRPPILPKMVQKTPKIARNLNLKLFFSSNLACTCFLGWENRWWCQNFNILKSWPLLWRRGPPLLPKMVRKTPIHHKNRKNDYFFSNLAWVCFLGWENRWWCQNSKILKSWPLLWRHGPPKMSQNCPIT